MSSPRDPTQFTRESAERIGRVVRAAELGAPQSRPLNFERVDFSRSRVFRVATYTGAWAINATKVVTFKYKTDTPNTATVLNLFFPVTNTAAGSRDCAIAKEGTSWFLVDVRFANRTAVFAGSTALRTVFGTGSTSLIRFIGTANTVAQTIVTGPINASLNTSACTISVTATTATMVSVNLGGTQTAVSVSMAGTQTFAVMQSTFTGTYLTLEV